MAVLRGHSVVATQRFEPISQALSSCECGNQSLQARTQL